MAWWLIILTLHSGKVKVKVKQSL